MKTKTDIGKEIDNWIRVEDMAPLPGLKPLRRFDEVHMPMSLEEDEYPCDDQDEIRAWHDWIKWFTQPVEELLHGIKQPPKGRAFYLFQKTIRGSSRTSPTPTAVVFPTNPPLFVPIRHILRILKITHCNYTGYF